MNKYMFMDAKLALLVVISAFFILGPPSMGESLSREELAKATGVTTQVLDRWKATQPTLEQFLVANEVGDIALTCKPSPWVIRSGNYGIPELQLQLQLGDGSAYTQWPAITKQVPMDAKGRMIGYHFTCQGIVPGARRSSPPPNAPAPEPPLQTTPPIVPPPEPPTRTQPPLQPTSPIEAPPQPLPSKPPPIMTPPPRSPPPPPPIAQPEAPLPNPAVSLPSPGPNGDSGDSTTLAVILSKPPSDPNDICEAVFNITETLDTYYAPILSQRFLLDAPEKQVEIIDEALVKTLSLGSDATQMDVAKSLMGIHQLQRRLPPTLGPCKAKLDHLYQLIHTALQFVIEHQSLPIAPQVESLEMIELQALLDQVRQVRHQLLIGPAGHLEPRESAPDLGTALVQYNAQSDLDVCPAPLVQIEELLPLLISLKPKVIWRDGRRILEPSQENKTKAIVWLLTGSTSLPQAREEFTPIIHAITEANASRPIEGPHEQGICAIVVDEVEDVLNATLDAINVDNTQEPIDIPDPPSIETPVVSDEPLDLSDIHAILMGFIHNQVEAVQDGDGEIVVRSVDPWFDRNYFPSFPSIQPRRWFPFMRSFYDGWAQSDNLMARLFHHIADQRRLDVYTGDLLKKATKLLLSYPFLTDDSRAQLYEVFILVDRDRNAAQGS